MVVSKFPFPPRSLPKTQNPSLASLASCGKRKSFISNAYKKHRGWGIPDCRSRAHLIMRAFRYTQERPQFLSAHGFTS